MAYCRVNEQTQRSSDMPLVRLTGEGTLLLFAQAEYCANQPLHCLAAS